MIATGSLPINIIPMDNILTPYRVLRVSSLAFFSYHPLVKEMSSR
jgi:hypothetical protein